MDRQMAQPLGDTAIEDFKRASFPAESKGTSHGASRIRRRNRMITSCLECRRRKLKCDKLHPCTNCNKFARNCMFLAPALDSVSQMKLTEIKEKMGSLERVLEHDVARQSPSQSSKRSERRKPSVDLPGQPETSSDEGQGPDDEKDLEPTPLSVIDAAYEDDTNDDMLDLGVRVGKMRMTERLGGYFRPKMSEELAFTISDPLNDRRTAEEKATAMPISSDSAEGFLEPGPTYIAPGAGFILGDVGLRKNLMDFLPSKEAADALISQYSCNVHCIAKVVHWPSFQIQYENFWTNVLMGIEPTASSQAIVFAVMFSAVASMSEGDIATVFSRPKRTVLINFQTGTEVALGKAQFLRTTKIETLQALIIYLIPMCRSELSRAHSVLVGAAIRLAECMGLHRDPGVAYNMSPIECHIRRTIWFQLCLLDIRTCESQGPRPGIRRDEYDTHFPLNINDVDLLSVDPKETETAFTDMTISRLRFECNEMHRVIWVDRLRLEKKQISITHVLAKIESFRRAMEAKYHPTFDDHIPLQHFARLLLSVLLLRMHIMVLHRYHNSVSVRIPDRLRHLILTSGTQQMEDAIKLETIPDLAPWRWCAGAFQQWQTAFLLLVEVFTYPMRKEADRIWDIIDYVFEPDRSLSRAQKGRLILSDLRDRTAIYRDIRKVRAPVSMTKRLFTKSRYEANPGSPSDGPTTGHEQKRVHRNTGAEEKHATGLKPESSPGLASNSSSPLHSSDPNLHSWSFDVGSTLFVRPSFSYNKDNVSRAPGGLLNNHRSHQSPANQTPPDYPGMGSSPSDISTNDSWPPFISNQQQSWNAPFATPSQTKAAPQYSNSITTQTQVPGIVGRSLAIPDALIGNDDQGLPAAERINQDLINDPMALDIDWNEWDKIFPPHVNTGILDVPGNFDLSTY